MWRKLEVIHVWMSHKLVTNAKNGNTCLLIENVKAYSVCDRLQYKGKSGNVEKHILGCSEDSAFWVVYPVSNTLMTPLPRVHPSACLASHSFKLSLCSFSLWGQALEFKINPDSFFFFSPSLEVKPFGSILSILVFGYIVKLYYLPPVRVSERLDWLKLEN